jgi:electron transfer flavoprotein alpha subunit
MDSDKSVLVFVERPKGEALEVSLEVLSKGRELASKLKAPLQAVMIGENNQEALRTMAGYGADRVCFLEHPLLRNEDPELYAQSLSRICASKNPAMVLLGATFLGNDLAGRLAARLKTGLVMDCLDLSLSQEGLLLQTRLIHGGRITGTFICPRSSPQIATIIPGAFEKKRAKPNKEARAEVFNPGLDEEERPLRIAGRIKADPETITLDEAEIIVSGGRGLGSRENFTLIRELAGNLGGVTGASLGAVDAELAERKCLVGQTGRTVSPDLYVACGISGSIYHVLGMKDSKAIVAINKDPGAEIFKYSDMGLVGDAVEIIKSINERLVRRSGKQPDGQPDQG